MDFLSLRSSSYYRALLSPAGIRDETQQLIRRRDGNAGPMDPQIDKQHPRSFTAA